MGRKDIYKDAVPFKAQGDIPPGAELAKRPLTVKVLAEVDTAIRALPEMSAWLRRVITEAASRELLGTVPQNREPLPEVDTPPVDVEQLRELRVLIEKRLAEGGLGQRDYRIFKAVMDALNRV